MSDPTLRAAAILDYWFGPLDDQTPLDRSVEPFRTHFSRWYGKDPAIDEAIRSAFAADLAAVAGAPEGWPAELECWAEVPGGSVALVILLDQLPRNMYRDTPQMYTHDALGLSAALDALRRSASRSVPICQRLFLVVPLMHVENLTLQREAVRQSEALLERARHQSPVQVPFVTMALDFARQHLAVVERFGRFPHRNAILGRADTADEREYLSQPGAGF